MCVDENYGVMQTFRHIWRALTILLFDKLSTFRPVYLFRCLFKEITHVRHKQNVRSTLDSDVPEANF